jgi:tungstate transport system permease protein
MNDIIDGFTQAIQLIVTLNPEVMEIAMRTLMISLTATLLASLVAIPLGWWIHFHEFTGKRVVINLIQTLYAVPTVLVGLLVYLLISSSGPLGILGLLFTPTGMIFAQMLLVIPMMIGLTITAFSNVDRTVVDTITSLGATGYQSMIAIIKEVRFAVFAAIILGFGRAISEVGAAMMIGGNIRGYTRVLTTSIALETSMGNLPLSIALGLILLAIALIITVMLNIVQERHKT